MMLLPRFYLLLSLLILVVAMIAALTVGRYPLPLADIVSFMLALGGIGDIAADQFDTLYNLIIEIRLPRIMAAVLVGAALSVSGAAFQAVFRNPLVSPGLLGVLGGAAFGAALGMVISGNWLIVQLLSFVMGLVAVAFGVLVARLCGKMSILMLVLGGVISSGMFAALLSIVKYVADPENQLPAIVYWLMGSFAQADLTQTGWLALPMLLGIVVLSLMGRALDALSMGDDEARTLGIPVNVIRHSVIVAATLISALTVSIAGMIGWVGLIIPHIARVLTGPRNALLLPVSATLGGIFLLVCDVIARTVMATEIPIGIITELIGIPVFLIVLLRLRKGWS
jgi:iron complex transport system permease protein